jgi:DNA-binding PadR family transcriptional regulator
MRRNPGLCMHRAYMPPEAAMGRDGRRRPESWLPLRPVEFHILLSLASGDRHGYGMIRDAEARGDAPVPDIGTLYRALGRLVENGWIGAAERRSAADAGDERRNYYRILPAGLEVARAEARRLAALTQAARRGGLLDRVAT